MMTVVMLKVMVLMQVGKQDRHAGALVRLPDSSAAAV